MGLQFAGYALGVGLAVGASYHRGAFDLDGSPLYELGASWGSERFGMSLDLASQPTLMYWTDVVYDYRVYTMPLLYLDASARVRFGPVGVGPSVMLGLVTAWLGGGVDVRAWQTNATWGEVRVRYTRLANQNTYAQEGSLALRVGFWSRRDRSRGAAPGAE